MNGDLHFAVAQDALHVVSDEAGGQIDTARLLEVADNRVLKPHRPSGAAGDSLGMFEKDARDPCPDGSQTDDCDGDGLVGHFSFLEERSVKSPADMRLSA
jgi:hypothetical protein